MTWGFRLVSMAVVGLACITPDFVVPAIGGNDLKVTRSAASARIAAQRDVTNAPPVMHPGSSARQGGGRANRVTSVQPQARLSEPGRRSEGIQPKHTAGKNPEVERVRPLSRGKVARRAHRHSREGKPQVTIAPKPDLSYYGMLEQPQRYVPQYQQGRSSAPNPNAGPLLHDHFQELDKNRDGSIDPFERALGRLDMDRDLADRQWQ